MLYVTTRNKTDAHTAHKTLTSDRGADGGLYVPFQIPVISKEYIDGFYNIDENARIFETDQFVLEVSNTSKAN